MDGVMELDFGALNVVDKVNAVAAISQTIAALLSLVALLLSLWVYSRQQHLNRWQLRLSREDHIIAWSRLCLVLMAEVEENVKAHTSVSDEMLSRDEFIRYRSRLSALIDEGRLYFPNINDARKGAEKDPAFRGSRQKVLDALVAFYGNLEDLQTRPGALSHGDGADALNRVRRTFISCTQDTIDPRRFNRIRA